jgi:hypothetical protein
VDVETLAVQVRRLVDWRARVESDMEMMLRHIARLEQAVAALELELRDGE